jgi:hypothetical protein
VFITAEDGLGALGADAFPAPERFTDVLEMLEALSAQQHKYKTVVVDSLDWLEPLVHAHVCAEAGVSSLEDVAYGKLYVKIPTEWRKFLTSLEKLQRTKGMNVILIAHQHVRTFANPLGADYDRYDLKLLDSKAAKISDLIKEWSDIVGYATTEDVVKDADGKAKATTTGSRVLHVSPSPARSAKTRYSLPDKLPLAWSALEAAVEASRPLSAVDCRRQIEERAGKLKAVDKTELEKYLQSAGDDVVRLNKTLNWVKGRT